MAFPARKLGPIEWPPPPPVTVTGEDRYELFYRNDLPGSVVLPTTRREPLMAISASEARRRLFPLVQEVNEERSAVEITSRHGNAVLISAEEYAAWQETAYLFRSPVNARRLLDAIEQAQRGDVVVHPLTDVD